MSKAFTKDDDGDKEPPFRSRFQTLPPGFRNLMTAKGLEHLKKELVDLQSDLLGLTEETRRGLLKNQVNDLEQRLMTHVVLELVSTPVERVGFGTTVKVRDDEGSERDYTLVGIDEADPTKGQISWISPLARALLNQSVGSVVQVHAPGGESSLEIVSIF